ncbi:MAG: glutamine-hydrolyzing carbamoyl-phosphate synthase small subunit [Candidatus Omnitrophica bacterium]|nr:glutamine-hydrolyzing carbamoyl-phosphate synthase small subunit [Candidatus Omnitrophota bacterium]MCM8816697.1 glutamine-hydrolyzing carbamoyl-phosphate synthase small subunit [Candidatus Omnitrophota bacterium]
MTGYLVIEDGTIYQGEIFGASGECFGELIFNTSMTGYQEIIYDPSYKGQIVTMTYPLIGNYGVNRADAQSYKIHLEGFVVKEKSKLYSNWRAEKSLEQLFKENNIIGIEGVDTRKITELLRDKGAQKAGIFSGKQDKKQMLEKVRRSPSLVGRDIVKDVIHKKPYIWNDSGRYKVVVIDCGVKYNTLQLLALNGMKVVVYPADSDYKEIEKEKPDGILISNGPGDPEPLHYVIKTVSNLVEKYPVFGICLGHQILGQVFGGKTYKLKFGHHGANHPVKDLKNGKIYITVQNHGFCVDISTIKDPDIEITHINLNDNTLEGIQHKKLPVFSVQFHPEDAPGPRDGRYLFEKFFTLVENGKKNRH